MRYPTRGYQRDSPSALLLRRPQEIPLPMEKPKTQISRLTWTVISAAQQGRSAIRARVRHDVRVWRSPDRSREIVSMIDRGHIYLDLPCQTGGVREAAGFSLSATFQGSNSSIREIL